MTSIYDMSSYYKLIKSPVATTDVKPITNFVQSAKSSELYAKSFAKQLQSSMSEYLTTVKDSTSKLKESGKEFTKPKYENVLDQKSASTTDNTSISTTVTSKAEKKSYTLNISQMAQSQQNLSNGLNSNDASQFDIGKNSFSISVGSKENVIEVNINPGDTNKSSLEKVAAAVNNKDIGVNAKVETKDNMSYLKLSSNDTGTKNSFKINDIQGNIVSTSGASNTTQESQDSKYKLNGVDYTSSSNKISTDNKNFEFTINKATNKDINISVDTDKQGIKQSVEKLVLSYNSIITSANNNLQNFNGASLLKSDLQKIVTDKSAALENVGLYSNEDGTLSINYDKLDGSINKNLNSVKNALGGANGFADKLSKKGSEIINSPAKYSKPASFDKNYEAYVSYMKALNNSTPANYLNKGSLVDMLL